MELELFPFNISQKDLFLDEIGLRDNEDISINGLWAIVNEDCNFHALEQAFWQVIKDNDALRIRVVKKLWKKFQIFQDYMPFALERIETRGIEGFNRLLNEYSKETISIFDQYLFKARLIDCGDGMGGIQIRIHHFCCDGYSLGMFMKEIDDNYHAIIEHRQPGKSRLFSFREAIAEDQKYLDSKNYLQDKQWMKKKFHLIQNYQVPTGKRKGSCLSKKIISELDELDTKRILDYSKENFQSIQLILMSFLAISVFCISGSKSFIIDSLFHNRGNFKLKNTMGCMVSTYPVVYQIDERMQISQFLEESNIQYLEGIKHSRLPFTAQLVAITKLSIKNRCAINPGWLSFGMMEWEVIADKTFLKTGLTPRKSIGTDCYVNITPPVSNHLRIDFEYRDNVFSSEKAAEYLSIYREIIHHGIKNTHLSIKELISLFE